MNETEMTKDDIYISFYPDDTGFITYIVSSGCDDMDERTGSDKKARQQSHTQINRIGIDNQDE